MIDDDSREVADLWARSQSGLGGLGHLPFRGGIAEQPAKLMDAFGIVSRTVELLKPKQ